MVTLDMVLTLMVAFSIGLFLFDLLHMKFIIMNYDKKTKEMNRKLAIEKSKQKTYTFDDFKK